MKASPQIAALLLLALCGVARAEKSPPDVTLQGHASAVIDVAFSRDGKLLASAGTDGLVNLWEVATARQLASFKDMGTSGNQVRFSPDGSTLVCRDSGNNVCVLDPKAGKLRKAIPFDVPGGPQALDISPDGKLIAVVGRGSLRFYDTDSGAQTASFPVHSGYGIEAVAFAPDGSSVATASSDKTALIIDVKSGRRLHALQTPDTSTCVAFSGDGKTLFTGSSDRTLRVYDIATGHSRILIEIGMEVMTARLAPEQKTIVLAGLGHAPWLLKLPGQEQAEITVDSNDWVKSADLSADGKWLAGGANGGAVFLWKMSR